MANRYLLDVRGKFVGIEVRVNDLPLATLKDGGNIPAARISHLIVPGQNSVSLRAFVPASQSAIDPEAFTTLRIRRDDETLYEHAWNANPGAPAAPPDTLGIFDAGDGLGAWSWQVATALALPVVDVDGLNTLFTKIHAAMSDKDLDSLISLLAHKNAEIARAFDLDPTRADSSHRNFFGGLFEDAAWAMEPLDLADAKHVLCADNRIVHTFTRDDAEPLRSTPNGEGSVYSLPILASHFDEGWVVVR